jgi:hypothetical protein
MNKKAPKKLRLTAETVRHLTDEETREVNGGITGTYPTSCPCRISFYPAEC